MSFVLGLGFLIRIYVLVRAAEGCPSTSGCTEVFKTSCTGLKVCGVSGCRGSRFSGCL